LQKLSSGCNNSKSDFKVELDYKAKERREDRSRKGSKVKGREGFILLT
jgi:hypothetical protein